MPSPNKTDPSEGTRDNGSDCRVVETVKFKEDVDERVVELEFRGNLVVSWEGASVVVIIGVVLV
jgi:hypothetical protein